MVSDDESDTISVFTDIPEEISPDSDYAKKLLEDEIIRGSGFSNGKFRISEYVSENSPNKDELAKFLKNEYGIGGSSRNDDPVSFSNHDGKGIELVLSNRQVIRFNWKKVAEAVRSAVNSGKYITESDIEMRRRMTLFDAQRFEIHYEYPHCLYNDRLDYIRKEIAACGLDYPIRLNADMFAVYAAECVRTKQHVKESYQKIDRISIDIPWKFNDWNEAAEQYRESMNLCDECGTLISRFIAENFNNNFLDVKKVTAEAAGKYGFERAMLMLALRIDSLKYDGRFTADNKEWAHKFLADYPNAEEIRKTADRTLGTAHPVLLNAVTEELRSAFRERNKQEIEGYRIVQRIQTPNSEFVLGQNKKMPGCYVTWYNADHNGGISTVWGHYFTSNDSQNNLVSAYRDLFSRALSDVNQHTRFEELTPKTGSIIRTVNGEDMQFELTDEECNGIWDMVEQQNVESHFADLLSENGFDVNSADVKKVITEMAAQYREDFGFGDDEEFQGYISEHDDDLKEHFNSDTFGNVYVDNSASDYTGRIMIIRPEYFSSRNFTPEEQLFLAQPGPGCDPKEYGGAVNGVFLYDREEASLTSDCFLGAMREEHIPMWAREARDDVSEEYDEQPEM